MVAESSTRTRTREPGSPTTAYHLIRGDTEPITVGPPSQQAPTPQFRPPPDPTTALIMAVERLGQLAPVIAEAAPKLAAISKGRGGSIVILVIAISSLIASSGLWIAHMATGDRSLQEQNERIRRLEQDQRWSRWALISIAKAVNAELPPQMEQ